MTDYDITDMAVCYPFLPAGTYTPDALKNIRDVRVTYALPAADYAYACGCLECALVSISQASLVFKLRCAGISSQWMQITVPVFVGSVPQATESYALAASLPVQVSFDDPSSQQTGTFRYLHPCCIRLAQEAPSLAAVCTAEGSAEDGSRVTHGTSVTSGRQSIAFSGKRNLDIGPLSGALSLNAYEGGGESGRFTVESYPYYALRAGAYERIQLSINNADGLRSINGHFGEVTMGGGASLTVTEAAETEGSDRIITIAAIGRL